MTKKIDIVLVKMWSKM